MALYFWLALIFFALGLMSKPMLVTLPFVMLLLDFWPLQRLSIRHSRVGAGKVAVFSAYGGFLRRDRFRTAWWWHRCSTGNWFLCVIGS